MKKGSRILAGVMFVLAVQISGCATVQPRYVSQFALPNKLPGIASIEFKVAPDTQTFFSETDNRVQIKERIESDINNSIFNGNPANRGQLTVGFSIGNYGKTSDPGCTLSAEYPVGLEIRSGNKVVGKYEASAKFCRNCKLCGNEYRQAAFANSLLMALDEIKKNMASGGASGSSAVSGGYAGAAGISRQNASGRINVAVSDLSAENVSQGNAAIVADWLRGALVAEGAYTVVERSAMQKVLTEQAFQNTGCTSSECAVKLGKVLNVQKMVVGSFGKFLDSYVLNVRVVDVESGEVVYSDSAKGKTTDEVEANIKALAQRLSR